MSNPQQNVSHPPFRPSPTRSATIGATTFKSRATSQPAGERSPAPLHLSGSQPDSGRGSPAGMFGVIGGSRTPKGGVGGRNVGGTATRANSFSAGEYRETRVSILYISTALLTYRTRARTAHYRVTSSTWRSIPLVLVRPHHFLPFHHPHLHQPPLRAISLYPFRAPLLRQEQMPLGLVLSRLRPGRDPWGSEGGLDQLLGQ